MEILVYVLMTFYICSFIGYIIEVLWIYVGTKKLVNRGFLCGPVIPIYGIGSLLIIFCLLRYYNDPVVVFVFGIIITSALEYFTSFLMEKIFHNRWWDYSNMPYNINGRICLRNSFAFGILSLIIIYLVTPLLYIVMSYFPFKVWNIAALVCSIIFIADVAYSCVVAYGLRNSLIIVENLKNEKLAKIPKLISKQIKTQVNSFKELPNRLTKAFPNLVLDNKDVLDFIEKSKKELEKKKNERKKKK